MKKIRVIPCLDVADGRVVKGINFIQLKDAGDPVELAQKYSLQGADELVFLDVKATTDNRETTLDMVQKVAKSAPISFTVGGGVRTVADAEKLLTAGANKISVSSAAVAKPHLINEISSSLGKEKLVVAIDVKKNATTVSGYSVVTHGGNKDTGKDALEWISEVATRGAGELLLTSMDADGTKDGFDSELLREVTKITKIPVIASGGAGTLTHFVDAAKAGAAAVLAASVFHFGVLSVKQVKEAIAAAGFEVALD